MRSRIRSWLRLPLPLVLGCIGNTSVSGVPPNPDLITIFYQLDGRVYGFGRPLALPAGTPSFFVGAHPTETRVYGDVNPDGSFGFFLGASSNDTLEIASAPERNSEERGPPIFMKVPPTPVSNDKAYCCILGEAGGQPQGVCNPDSNRGLECAGLRLPGVNDCVVDSDCSAASGEVISIPPDAISVTAPDLNHRVTVSSRPGGLPPLNLVRVENRGKRGAGGEDRGLVSAKITDPDGVFTLDILGAFGDDELVIQVFDLTGFRSRQHAEFVPDASFTSLEILGVIPYTSLMPNATGKILIRYHLQGADGLGLCPSSSVSAEPRVAVDSPASLCFSGDFPEINNFNGGLDHDAVKFQQLSIDGQPKSESDFPKPAPPDPANEFYHNRFVDGEWDTGPLVVYLVIDSSILLRPNGMAIDPLNIRFRAAESVVRALRSMDELAILGMGVNAPDAQPRETFVEVIGPTPIVGDENAGRPDNRPVLIEAIRQYERCGMKAGGAGPCMPPSDHEALTFKALIRASQEARARAEQRSRVVLTEPRVILLSMNDPSGSIDFNRQDVEQLFASVLEDENALRGPVPTFVAGLDVERGRPLNVSTLQDMASFSGGAYLNVQDPDEWGSIGTELAGRAAGAFLLVYDLPVPDVGKAMEIDLTALVTIDQRVMGMKVPAQQAARFVGTVFVRDASRR